MPEPRKRRIVRRAVMVVAVVVLLPAWYLGSVVLLVVGGNSGIVPAAVFNTEWPYIYIVPLNWYVDADLPGSDELAIVLIRSAQIGRSLR